MPLTRAKCRSCEAPIFWVFTENGRRMPIDADPVAEGNVVLVQEGSGRRAIVLGPPELFESDDLRELRQRTKYMPHHATCPHADEWRNTTRRT